MRLEEYETVFVIAYWDRLTGRYLFYSVYGVWSDLDDDTRQYHTRDACCQAIEDAGLTDLFKFRSPSPLEIPLQDYTGRELTLEEIQNAYRQPAFNTKRA